MAAELFLFPFPVALNANGVVVPGAKLQYYLTGTSTPTPVYSDSGLVTPLSNPVVANSAGVWPSIYYNTTVAYRVVLKDSADAVLGEVDPYIPGVVGGLTQAFEDLYTDTVAVNALATASATSAAEDAASAALSAAAAAAEVVDGYHYHPTFGTRFQGYELVNGVLTDVISPELYWDPFKVGASGTGATHAEAVKTSAEVRAWLALNTGRRTVAVHSGAQGWIRDQLDLAEGNTGNGLVERSQLSLVSYSTDGSQKLAFFNGMDGVNAASWSAHATIANAYTVSHTHGIYAVAINNLRVFQTLSGYLQPLNRVATVAETSTAGTYWYDNTLAAAGTETVVAHFWSNVNPITQANGFAEITVREYAFSGRANCFAQGIAGFATGSNNGSLFMYSGGARGCFLEEGTKHNWVAGAIDFRGVVAYNSFSAANYVGTATTPALATTYSPDPAGATYNLTDCFSICNPTYYTNTDGGYSWASAFYAHGSTSAIGRLVITGGGDNCIDWATQAQAHTISGYTVVRRAANAYGIAADNLTISGCLILNAKNGIVSDGSVLDVEGNVIVSAVGGNSADIESYVDDARIVRNLIFHPSASVEPRILLHSPRNPIVEENVVDGPNGGPTVKLDAALTGTMRLNKNYYVRPADPPGTDYPNLLQIGATAYADLANVRALGYEADGAATALGVIADAKFTSGQAPTPTALDVRFNADSPVLLSQTEQIAQAIVNALDEQVSTKVTRTAALAFVQGYDWYPVRVALTAELSVTTGVPVGGATGQVLTKASAADYDTAWATISGSGTVTSVAATVPVGFAIAGSPVTTTGTLAITFSAGYALPTTAKQTEWDTAYTDRNKWDGGATGLTAATGRTSLGLGTAAVAATGDFAPIAHVGVGGTAHADVIAAGAAGFMTGADKTKLDGVATGATANTGTVTSVALTAPTGLTVGGSPVTTTGTLALTYTAGFQGYTSTEATKLSGIATAATANSSDATLLARANHTGSQAISTVTGLQTALDGKQAIVTLGLWDNWFEFWMGAQTNNTIFWSGAAISSGTLTTTPAGMVGYNNYGLLFRSSTTTNSGYRFSTITAANDYFGTISHKFRCYYMPATAFTNNTVRIGYLDTTTSADATDGAYFEISSAGVVSAKTAAAGTRTTHGTTYTATIDVPLVFDVEVNAAGTSARFRVYAGTNTTPVLDVTNTTNIPTTSANAFGSGIVATNVGTMASDIGVLYGLAQGTIDGFTRARG